MQSFLWIALLGWNGTTVVFLEGLLTLNNVYEKVKIFEIIESKKLKGNVDEPFAYLV